MSQTGTRPWWAEVEHLREQLERRGGRLERRVGAEPNGRGAHSRSGGGRFERPEDAERNGEAGQAPPAPRAGSEDRLAGTGAPALDPPGAGGHPGRRTVVIRGQAIPTVSARPLIEVRRRRPPRRPIERLPGQPDRIALWAVMLGGVLLGAAALTGHA